MKKLFFFLHFTFCILHLQAQNVGIGTATPEFKLSLDDDGGILAEGTYGSGATLSTGGAGTRMLWYPKKAAFRAGYVTGTQWDNAKVGAYSFATGYGTTASGYNSTAMGAFATASGTNSTAMGNYAVASGYYSTAMGNYTIASGNASTAMGVYASTAGYSGAFSIGDNSNNTYLNSTANNEMSMRFDGGYRLFSNAGLTAGVEVSAGGGSWSSVSDRRLKENFRTINSEELLQKVAALPITNWNYKSQPSSQRHIGPMAQDFYAAFHLDGEGADTTINTMDISGVNMAAIQALEKRTVVQSSKIQDLQKENEMLRTAFATLQAQMKEMQRTLPPKMTQ